MSIAFRFPTQQKVPFFFLLLASGLYGDDSCEAITAHLETFAANNPICSGAAPCTGVVTQRTITAPENRLTAIGTLLRFGVAGRMIFEKSLIFPQTGLGESFTVRDIVPAVGAHAVEVNFFAGNRQL